MIRKLTTFTCPSEWEKLPLYRISFAYYQRDKFGNLQWTGDSERCELTEGELYEMLKPKLNTEHTEVKEGGVPIDISKFGKLK